MVPGGVPLVPGRVGGGALMETKLHVPVLRRGWVQREDLVGFLAGCSSCRVVLVEAPAGSGKTIAVAQWAASATEGRPFAWVCLDRGDDDPARLWLHVVSAVQRACPAFGGADIVRALRSPVPDIAGVVLPRLANELAGLGGPVVLVLDDFHVVSDRGCQEQVGFLVSVLPAGVQLVLVTRADPPVPLARLRAAGELAEVRARELRFSAGQVAALVRSVAGVDLAGADLAGLVERTEGWPAGVYLAALSLRGHCCPAGFVREFTGGNRFIVDFLAEEVLARQPARVREFLTRIAVLGRFCASLCEAVTGLAGAAELIELIERDNLFLVPLDDRRGWYRFHHLFGQVLAGQLAGAEPDLVPVLHRRASAWHRRWGSAEEAIDHALAAGEVAGAVGLIAEHWHGFMDTGRAGTVRGWLGWLGAGQIGADPVAAHCAAWCAALTGDVASVRRWLPVLEAAGDSGGSFPDGITSPGSSAALLRGCFGFDGLEVMLQAARTAAGLEGDPASPWYGLARIGLGSAWYLSGAPGEAAAALGEALASAAAVGPARVAALSLLAVVRVEGGQGARAAELVGAARRLVAEGDLGETQQGSGVWLAAGVLSAAQGRTGQARAEFEHALAIRRRWVEITPWPVIDVMVRLAGVLDDLGERAAAAALAAEAGQLLAGYPDGAQAQRDRVHRLQRRLTRARPDVAGDPLTARQLTVLRLLQGTMSLREIGQELYLSPNTVKTHTRAAYRKLGASTRRDAVARAQQAGVL